MFLLFLLSVLFISPSGGFAQSFSGRRGRRGLFVVVLRTFSAVSVVDALAGGPLGARLADPVPKLEVFLDLTFRMSRPLVAEIVEKIGICYISCR